MKRNHLKKNKAKKSSLAITKEHLSQFQRKSPYKFRQVFDLYQKGLQELRADAIQEAKASFEKALSIYQKYIPVQNQLALTYGKLENYKEALNCVKTVLKLDDNNVFAFLQGSIFLYKLGKEKEAGVYVKSALIAFHEREGQDPYNDYDLLQKLVEMLSILRYDTVLSNLYKARKDQFSPISLYRAALALSNKGFSEEAISALQSINEQSDYKNKGMSLKAGIETSIKQGLPIPMLFSEDEIGIKQVETISLLFNADKQKSQAGLTYLTKDHNNWSTEVTKALLKLNILEITTKKSLLSILAKWSPVKQKVEVRLGEEMYEIPLNNLEIFDELVTKQTSSEQLLSLKTQDIIQVLDGYTKDKLILAVKAFEIRGYSKLNKKALIELIVKEIIEKGSNSEETTELGQLQKIIELMSEQIER